MKEPKRYYAGLDVSTQGAKLLVLDYGARCPVFVTAVNFDRDLPDYGTVNGVIQGLGQGVSESDPAMWIEAVEILFTRLKKSGVPVSAIRALSVSGQQHGLVCLDANGNLTRKRSKLWNDVSTMAECADLTKAVGGPSVMVREIQNLQKPGYTAGKILRFKRENPAAFKRTATFFLVHNYINWHLTGGVRVMEPGDVSGMACWSPRTGRWSGKVCEAIDKTLLSRLPGVRPADEFIGTVSPALCARYGFSPSCRVDAGSGDNMYGAIGTGNVKPGFVTISLGTSGTACTIYRKPYCDPQGEIASYCDAFGNYMALLCVMNLANGYNKLLRDHRISHADFERIIRKTPAGNSGLALVPWYTGERTPNLPMGAPLYFGFGLDDFTVENLCRAVLEGHVMNLYEGFLKLNVAPSALYLTGGIAKSCAWRRTIADIFNCTVVPVKGEGAALGAAIHAAYVDHKNRAPDLHAFVKRFVELETGDILKPERKNVRAYDRFKRLYLSLSARLRGSISSDDPFELKHSCLS